MGQLVAGAIRIPTVSYDADDVDGKSTDLSKFLDFHTYLRASFPRVHGEKHITCTVVNEYSLVYEWEGEDASLAPVMLCAHLDVVPAPDEQLWQQPPFSGQLAPDPNGDLAVWGRGAIDNKHNVISQLQALELLLGRGDRPRRTIFFAYGHDEEIGGWNGARHIAEHIKQRLDGRKLEFILDEGAFIVHGVVPGAPQLPIAYVCNQEKGYVTLKLTVDDIPSGHALNPPRESNVGILSRAVARLEARPFPSHVQGYLNTMRYVASEFPTLTRTLIANSCLFGGLLRAKALANQRTAPLLRTTTAVTILRAGSKVNAVPQMAQAWVNHRIHPGDGTLEEVLKYNRRVIGDSRVKMEVVKHPEDPGAGWLPPSPASSVKCRAFTTIKECVADCFGVPTAPLLMSGNTDTRHYWDIAEDIYRFTPVAMHVEELKMFHGINERVSLDNLARLLSFYSTLLRSVIAWDETGTAA